MTDMQIALLLRQYAAHLSKAITDAYDDLPPEAKATRKVWSIDGTTDVEYAPCLDDLRELLGDIYRDCDLLESVAKGVAANAKR